MLNPFNVLGLGSAGFNPLAALDPASANFYDDAAALGEALISIEGDDPHWSQSAQGLLVALLMWEKIKNGDAANLENVRAHADRSGQVGALHRRRRQATRAANGGLSVTAADMVAEGGYEIASLAARFTERTNEIDQHPFNRRHANALDIVGADARRSEKVGRGFCEAQGKADDGLCHPARRTHAHAFAYGCAWSSCRPCARSIDQAACARCS